jgi:asparagine synthase (glutamine-hydrolysing)
MCGICGVMYRDSERTVDPAVLRGMTDALVHRGPDSAGGFRDRNVALGFRRLAIIDLAGGDQPLSNEDGSVVLVCNGEIFNYRELRAALEARGHRFRTDTDVEVIPHLYEEDGVRLLHRIRGQFAFALFDRRAHELLLARDPVGINPLHVTVTADGVLFASEIKALLAHPGVPREVDLTGLDQVLSFPGLVSPRTMFRGIETLPGGHYAIVRDGAVTTYQYWDLVYPVDDAVPPTRPERDYVEQLDALLARAVSARLRADVPVGVYLSGGLDSSVITAEARRADPGLKLPSFSVAIADHRLSEARYQRLVASHLGCPHHEIPFGADDIATLLPAAVRHAECPVKESYHAASLALSRRTKETGTSVVLAGEGADELFAGYPGYRFDAIGTRRGARVSDDHARRDAAIRATLWGDEQFFYEKDYAAFGAVKRELYAPALADALARFDCFNAPLVDHARLRGRHALHQRSYVDVKVRLAEHLLGDHGDRLALAHAVEARYPFLDADVIEFARTLPPALKLKQYTEKYIVRRVADSLLPPVIARREKFGFAAPGSPCLLRRDIDWVDELLSPERIRRDGYFNPVTVERLVDEYSRDGFVLRVPIEEDVLMIVLTFGLFRETFDLPRL